MSETKMEYVLIDENTAPPRVSESRRFFRVFLKRRVVLFGLIIILLLIISAIFAPFIAPYSPYKTDVSHSLAKPSAQHWLGTDSVGRDLLSRIIYGSRTSLLVSVIALTLASGLGMSLGLIAGYFGHKTYAVIMRIMDSLMSIPMILLALTIAAVLGAGMISVFIALGVALVPTYARLMCGEAITIKQADYVMAARSLGNTDWRIMIRHVLPNCLPPLIVMMTLQLGTTILAEAGLSFLGAGIRPPTASWGGLVSDGYRYLTMAPLLSIAPGVAIMLVVFAFNMVGDGLRDALDSRLRGIL
jgi:peptide/nickel transport system permease protein